MADDLKKKTVKGVAWSGIERFTAQGMNFVFNILIARVLLPEDYGVVAMLGIFIAVSNTFIDSGFANALIRKIDRTEDDFNTVFYFNIAMSAFFCALLWIFAPAIANFYNIPMLVKITRIISLTLVISAFSAIQSTKLTIDINFKAKAIVTIISVFIIGCVGLVMARKGYGVWALVAQSVVGSVVRTVLLWVFVRWVPKLRFSWKSFKEMFGYGSKLLASALIDTIYNNVYTLVIGKFFSPSSLGVYNKAESFAAFPSSSLSSMLGSVTFPVLSQMQNDQERLQATYKRFLNVSAFVVFPMMVGLAAVADPFVRIVLTDNWAGMIYLLQILCFSLMWYPIHAINLNILQVKGRSDLFLKLEILKKCQGIVILIVTIPMGLVAMCYGRIVSCMISLWLNTMYSKDLIDYGYWAQMKNYLRILALSVVMGAAVFAIVKLLPNLWAQLLAGTAAGVLIYAAGAKILRFPEFDDLLGLIKRK